MKTPMQSRVKPMTGYVATPMSRSNTEARREALAHASIAAEDTEVEARTDRRFFENLARTNRYGR